MSKALAESGAKVAIMYVSSDKTKDTAADIAKQFNVKCEAYKAPINDAEAVKQVIDQIHKDFGSIDILVANAGVNTGGASEVSETNVFNYVSFVYKTNLSDRPLT